MVASDENDPPARADSAAGGRVLVVWFAPSRAEAVVHAESVARVDRSSSSPDLRESGGVRDDEHVVRLSPERVTEPLERRRIATRCVLRRTACSGSRSDEPGATTPGDDTRDEAGVVDAVQDHRQRSLDRLDPSPHRPAERRPTSHDRNRVGSLIESHRHEVVQRREGIAEHLTELGALVRHVVPVDTVEGREDVAGIENAGLPRLVRRSARLGLDRLDDDVRAVGSDGGRSTRARRARPPRRRLSGTRSPRPRAPRGWHRDAGPDAFATTRVPGGSEEGSSGRSEESSVSGRQTQKSRSPS